MAEEADSAPPHGEPSNANSNSASAACAQCSNSPESLRQCNKCHSVSYCNKDCQKGHFKTHKKECASRAQEYMKHHKPNMASRAPPRESDRNTGYKKWQFDT